MKNKPEVSELPKILLVATDKMHDTGLISSKFIRSCGLPAEIRQDFLGSSYGLVKLDQNPAANIMPPLNQSYGRLEFSEPRPKVWSIFITKEKHNIGIGAEESFSEEYLVKLIRESKIPKSVLLIESKNVEKFKEILEKVGHQIIVHQTKRTLTTG
ncbi:MAG: hypothetical protein WCP93_01315 [Candidatus Berkelbacteria bacterium]